MTDSPTTFTELMALERHGPDTWIGLSAEYSWGRIYGGQVVAQALWAAYQTVEPDFGVHSLHAYFIRGGVLDEPVRLEVDRLRNGRSFCTRAVVARQSGGAILHLSASFHVVEDAPEIQTARMPLAPDPEDVRPKPDDWPWIMERRPLDLIQVLAPPWAGSASPTHWPTIPDSTSADWRSAPTPSSSDGPQHPSRSAHRRRRRGPVHGSEPRPRDVVPPSALRADQWHLYHWDCHGLTGARGMTVGNLFASDGTHVATVAQEVLLRERTKPR
ncbi:MAG: thioesterase family protein [Acidimicrobiales bacterium]